MTIRGWLGTAAWPVLALATSAALAGWLAFAAAPFDLVNNLLPLWLGAGLAAAGVILACRGRSAGLAICLAVMLASGLPPVILEAAAAWSEEAPTATGETITLLQFNVLKSNATPAAVATWIERERPDVITMEETLSANRLILQQLRPLYPYQVSCLSRLRCSTVILSRRRPLASGGLARGDPENQAALSAAWARFAGRGGPFTVVAVHMVRPWPWGEQEGGRAALAAFLAGLDRRRTIVAGDFNLTPWTVAMRHQDRMLGLPRRTRLLPTWPAMVKGRRTPAVMPIDHVYSGADWRPVSIRRGPSLGSDHRPVIAVLRDAGTPPAG